MHPDLTTTFRWLCEPSIEDNSLAKDDESLIEWLSRSTLDRACYVREFLRYNIDLLPERFRSHYCKKFQRHWHSALFEIIVARTFQAIGADLSVEEELPTGRVPDLKVRFDDITYVVEATCLRANAQLSTSMSKNEPLIRIIRDACPDGWGVYIGKLPDIGQSDSKRAFKRAVNDLYARIDVASVSGDSIELKGSVGGKEIMFTLVRGLGSANKWLGGPSVAFWSDALSAIERVLNRKRKQVRGSYPAILAINANLRATLADFDRAIFGEKITHINGDRDPVKESFQASGQFGRSRNKEGAPTYAGILVYTEAGFTCSVEPVLYLNPRFSEKFPAPCGELELRILEDGQRIAVSPARASVLQRLISPLAPSFR